MALLETCHNEGAILEDWCSPAWLIVRSPRGATVEADLNKRLPHQGKSHGRMIQVIPVEQGGLHGRAGPLVRFKAVSATE